MFSGNSSPNPYLAESMLIYWRVMLAKLKRFHHPQLYHCDGWDWSHHFVYNIYMDGWRHCFILAWRSPSIRKSSQIRSSNWRTSAPRKMCCAPTAASHTAVPRAEAQQDSTIASPRCNGKIMITGGFQSIIYNRCLRYGWYTIRYRCIIIDNK